MRALSIDIETYSSEDLTKSGVYRYAESPDFAILLFGFAYDDDPVTVIDLARGEELPDGILKALMDSTILKTAWNAAFEITCISSYFNLDLDVTQWECSMVKSAMLGLPLSLDMASKVLQLPQEKMKAGKALIRYFSVPCKPTKVNQGRTRNLPHHGIDKWNLYKEYNGMDVEVERAIRRKIAFFDIPEKESRLWYLDQKINKRGVLLDMQLVSNAISMDESYQYELEKEAKEITGLDNPNSGAQLKAWLSDEMGEEIETLRKGDVPDLIKSTDDPKVVRLLELRQEMSRTSVKKYQAMAKTVCADGRVKGLFQFYGANRTGRWAGRLVQMQNLPQNHLNDLELARDLVKENELDIMKLTFGNVPDTLSQLIRTAFIASEGNTLYVADFSAIEARVIAWWAKEKWRLDVFNTHGKIYEASAAAMFGVPLESVTKGSDLRQKGKVAELACIAEGQRVLTDYGYIPIENLTTQMLVWDGNDFVQHDGVVYKGIKKIIKYGKLKATEDHLVWVEGKSRPVPFGYASNSGSRLSQSRASWEDIRKCKNIKFRKKIYTWLVGCLCTNRMPRVWETGMGLLQKLNPRKIKWVPTLFSTKTNTQMARQKIYSSETEMRKSQRPKLQKLWRTWYKIQLLFGIRSWSMDDRKLRFTRSNNGIRPNRCKWSLRSRKSSLGNASNKLQESKKVYDILNCGSNNRFTVNGYLVHNCGYQGGVGALKAMGADKMGLTDEELLIIITNWRRANKNIVQLWYSVESAAIETIKTGDPKTVNGVTFYMRKGILFMGLPSGRSLSYLKPRVTEKQTKVGLKEVIQFEGINQTTKQWSLQDTYGGKLVENAVQAMARDCLAEKLLLIEDVGYSIVLHVHDEVGVEAPLDPDTLNHICEIMSQPIAWASGLPLRADGYVTDFYKKE